MILILGNNFFQREHKYLNSLTLRISFLLHGVIGESITKYYLQWNGIFIIGISYFYTTCYISSLRNEKQNLLKSRNQ